MPCRSDTSSRAPSILYSIQSESELKERRLISASTHPGGFSIWLWGSPKLWGKSFIQPLLVKHYWFYRTRRTARFWAYPLVCTENIFVHHLHLPQKWGHPSWWGQSKRPHSNLGRCRCVLLWYRVSYGNPISEQSISWRIELRNQIGYSGRNSHADASNLCLQFTWRYGNLPLPSHPKANALIDRIYHSQALRWRVPIPCYTPAGSRRRATATHFST